MNSFLSFLRRLLPPPAASSAGCFLRRLLPPPAVALNGQHHVSGHDARCFAQAGLLVLIFALSLFPGRLEGATVHRWVSENGGGTGLDSGSPATFSMALVNGWLADTQNLPDLQVNFKVGTYNIGLVWPAYFEIKGDTGRSVALVGVPENGVKPKLVLSSIQNLGIYYADWTKSIVHHWMIRMEVDGTTGVSDYLNRIVIEELELDGNFANQGSWTSEANATGYKSFALQIAAKTGRIRNVNVRNFGSVGDVPGSVLHQQGGVEAFPVNVRTFDQGQTPPEGSGDSNPWVIENVEVSDFHSVHGGYGTMIMPEAFQEEHEAMGTPLFGVRRCRVYGNAATIAFGTAGRWGDAFKVDPALNLGGYKTSGRILYEDNLVVGALTGFNTDTGPIGPLTFDNNAFLDVVTWGWLGVPVYNGGPAPNVDHSGYVLTDNLVRLRGWPKLKTWTDVCIGSDTSYTTDPNLALGRWETFRPNGTTEITGRASAGLVIQGGTGAVTLEGNDFTTWRRDNFYLPDPVNGQANATYHLVWKLLGNTAYSCWLWPRTRGPVQGMTLNANNRLSGTAYDFANFTALPTSGGVAINPFTESSSTQYTQQRQPTTTGPTDFIPEGRLGRVYSFLSGNNLTAVQEVQIGSVSYDPGVSNGKLTVKARLVKHTLRDNGGTPATSLVNTTLRLKYERRNADWSTTAPAAIPQATTDGIATFELTGLNTASGVCRLTVWQDVGTVDGVPGVSGTWQPYHDVWAAHDFSLPSTGSNVPVVELTTTVDVGDDKHTTVAKRARIQATRSFATGSSQTVNVTLHGGVFFRPASSPNNTDLKATYGTAGDADYYIVNGTGTWATSSPFTTATITIPANQTTGEVQVVTRADNLTEQNLIIARLAQNGTAYAPGVSTEARILIFDGPLWTLQPLAMDYGPGYQTLYSSAYAINDAVGATQPRITGYGSWQYTYGGSTTTYYGGGYWPLPGLSFSSLENTQFYGVSTDPVKFVGISSGNARLRPLYGAGVNLPHLSQSPSGAWGISPDGSYTAGFSANSGGVKRPVVWTGTSNPVDLIGTGYANAHGEARTVNDTRVAVGAVTGRFSSSVGKRGFRTPGGASFVDLHDNDDLKPPSDKSSTTPTAGAGVDSTGNAIGTYTDPITMETFALYWPARTETGSANPAATHLGVWWSSINGNVEDAQSFATAVSISGITGESRITGKSRSSGGSDRAVFRNGYYVPWIDLNDRHYTHNTSGWILTEATALNNNDVIIGNGTLNGVSRGFILIPRTSGN